MLNENEVKKIFGFLRDKLEKSERERKRLLSTYPDDHEIKTNLASLERINNGFDVVFDLLEVTMKNILYQNETLKKLVQGITSSDISESMEEIRNMQTKIGETIWTWNSSRN